MRTIATMENIQDILFQQTGPEEKSSLLCMVCKNYLSIPPIIINDTLGSICGRENCAKLANMKGTSYRQNAYEVLAKFLNFPCMHKENGCQDKFNWEEIGQHEKVCKYANFVCPFTSERFNHLEDTTCSWEGNASELSDHLTMSHPSHRFDNFLQFNLENDIKQNQIYFTNILESIVIILVIDKKSCFHLKVWSGPDIWRNLTYKTEIYTERAEVNALKTRKPELIQPSFSRSKINNTWVKVNFAYIRDFFESPTSLAIKFYIDGVVLGPSQKSFSNPNSLLLKDAKCVQCLQELTQPVYVCKSKMAHNICFRCIVKSDDVSKNISSFGTLIKQDSSPRFIRARRSDGSRESASQLQNTDAPLNASSTSVFGIPLQVQSLDNISCPECKSIVSRNIAFEKLKLITNQLFQTCVLCFKKVEDLMNHLTYNHKQSIYQLNTCYSDFSLEHYFFLFDNNIFLFSKIFTIDNKLSFGVQCLGTREIKYKYELQLINSKYGSYSSVTFGNFCHPESIHLRIQENGGLSSLSHETLIPHDVLRNIFPDINSIGFKLNISWL